jgi:hypothetical protein
MISLSANAVAQLNYKLDDLNVRDTFRFSLPELLENFMTEAISVTCRLLVQKLRFPLHGSLPHKVRFHDESILPVPVYPDFQQVISSIY